MELVLLFVSSVKKKDRIVSSGVTQFTDAADITERATNALTRLAAKIFLAWKTATAREKVGEKRERRRASFSRRKGNEAEEGQKPGNNGT